MRPLMPEHTARLACQECLAFIASPVKVGISVVEWKQDAFEIQLLLRVRRQGEASADALQQQFALAFQGGSARELFLELAELLPSAEQRSQLLRAAEAAGWAPQPTVQEADMSLAAAVITSNLGSRAEPDQAAAPGAPEEASGAGDPGWQPLDRSRIAEAASAMSDAPINNVQVIAFLPSMHCMLCTVCQLIASRVLQLPWNVLCSVLGWEKQEAFFGCSCFHQRC